MYCALFWIQGKTNPVARHGAHLLYCALFWIQGKTTAPLIPAGCILYCALFWIQGKTTSKYVIGGGRLYCALFWIQGKTMRNTTPRAYHCTVPYFGFKAKQSHDSGACELIVLCLILDSRQNAYGYVPVAWLIVLCLILDSRQNVN